eukprot:Sspe_Gene.61170::Locus_33877_Transcript_1_1_Confidence_1.000_Length_765::g.61170::m.61170
MDQSSERSKKEAEDLAGCLSVLTEAHSPLPPPEKKGFQAPLDFEWALREEGDNLGFADEELLRERAKAVEEWDSAPKEAFFKARRLSDPLGEVSLHTLRFRTRAALKLAEIDRVYGVTRPPLDPEDNGVLYYVDLCGAPGSWTEYLLLASTDKAFRAVPGVPPSLCVGWGISLRTGNPALDWQIEKFNRKARSLVDAEEYCYWGPTGDGDLTANSNIIDFYHKVIRETNGTG